MTTLRKIRKGDPPLVIRKNPEQERPQTVEERLAAIEARLERIEEMLKQALGR